MLSATPLPALGPGFWVHGLMGGMAQILATVCVVLLFKQRNFAVGITFKKTEVILTVLVGWVILGEGVSATGFAAIALGVVGLLLLSGGAEAKGFHLRDLRNRAAGLGVASGALFAVSAVSYRGASLAVMTEQPVLRAGVTLAAVVMMQSVIMAVYLRLREPGQIRDGLDRPHVYGWIAVLVHRLHAAERGLCQSLGASGAYLECCGHYAVFPRKDQHPRSCGHGCADCVDPDAGCGGLGEAQGALLSLATGGRAVARTGSLRRCS